MGAALLLLPVHAVKSLNAAGAGWHFVRAVWQQQRYASSRPIDGRTRQNPATHDNWLPKRVECDDIGAKF